MVSTEVKELQKDLTDIGNFVKQQIDVGSNVTALIDSQCQTLAKKNHGVPSMETADATALSRAINAGPWPASVKARWYGKSECDCRIHQPKNEPPDANVQ